MRKSGPRPQPAARRLTAISLAVTAALAAMTAPAAKSQTVISGVVTTTQTWTSGSFTVDSGASVVVPGFTAVAAAASVIGTLSNSGTIGTITNDGTIPIVVNYGTIIALKNRSSINSVFNTGSFDTLTNSIGGSIISVANFGSIGTLTNNIGGTINGVLNTGSIDTLTNHGLISINGNSGFWNYTGGTIGTLTNSGTISASGYYGILNDGSITTLSNSGAITSSNDGIHNDSGATIETLINSGTITGSGYYGIVNEGGGTIGTIGTLTNSGSISGGRTGVVNNGTIGTLTNSGTISGGNAGIVNSGTIGALTNSGMLNGGATGIINTGTIGTITSSSNAIYNEAGDTIGTIVNSGVIAGNIVNASSHALTISGGMGTTFGTLTGFNGAMSTITSTSADLVFGSGNLLLNDTINVGSHTVNNTSATLEVDRLTTITGNYSQGQAATLLIGVANGATSAGSLTDTGYGRLVVSGDAAIAAGSSVQFKSTTGGYGFAAGQRFVVVDAAGVGTYNASSLNYSIAGYTSTLTGATVSTSGHTDLVVTVDSATIDTPPSSSTGSSTAGGSSSSGTPSSPGTPSSSGTQSTSPASFASLATQPNAANALRGLLGYTGVDNAGLLNLYDATLASLADSSSSTANQIGKQLAPMQTQYAGSASTLEALGVVNAHVDALRIARAEGATGVATGEGSPRWTAWGQAFGGHASQGERDGVDGYSANYGGLLVGADRAFGERWQAGGAFQYSHTAIDATGDTSGDSAGVNAYGLIGYASYEGAPWYVNLSGAATLQHYDTTRVVSMTGYSGAAYGRFSGQQYVAHAEAGWPLAVADATLTPLASLTYNHLNQAGYTESGGNGAALAVDGTRVNSVRSALGAKLDKAFQTKYGELVPELRVQWIHEYDRAQQTTGASFAADATGETAFTTVGATPVSNLADVSLGVTLVRASNLSISARYELQAGSGFMSNTGILRLQQRF